jgi:hypothetical protein
MVEFGCGYGTRGSIALDVIWMWFGKGMKRGEKINS